MSDVTNPTPTPGQPKKTHGLAIASLICGIASVFCCIAGIAGLITGIIGKKKIEEQPDLYEGDKLCTWGIILSIVFMVLNIIATIFLYSSDSFSSYM